MREHLRAVRTFLAPLGRTVHLFRADGPGDGVTPPVPYLVLGAGWEPGEAPLCGTTDSVDTEVVITCVGESVEAADVLAGVVRRHVSPSGALSRVPMTGRFVQVRVSMTTQAEPDRDMRLPGTGGTHPGVAHVLLRLTSEPITQEATP